jgi:hypothetical protein
MDTVVRLVIVRVLVEELWVKYKGTKSSRAHTVKFYSLVNSMRTIVLFNSLRA